jgi:EpsG family
MTAYWILFGFVAALALTNWPQAWGGFAKYVYAALFTALSILIGFRFLVGSDWFNYEVIYLAISRSSFTDGLAISDPAYSLINWVVGQWGGSVWHVNLICAMVFSYALLQFINTLPSPGAALVAAVPTLVIVVAMGYTRQSCAVSCIMLAATAFRGRFELTWVIWLTIGVAFHKSTIFVFPVFFFAASENRTLSLVVGGVLGLWLLSTLILGNIQGLLAIYVEAEQQSGGAAIRLTLAVVTGLVFMVLPKAKEIYGARHPLWRNMAIASLVLVPAYALVQSSTIIDRIAVLFLPLQLVMFSGLSTAIVKTPLLRGGVLVAVAACQLAVLIVWLYFSANSFAWIPYRNVLFEQFV